MSGKQQKYSRVGPREFVAYEYEEVTAENIKAACRKHFKPKLGTVCDILAGEQGPSCKSVDQIPDLRVMHIRFIESSEGGGDSDDAADDAFNDDDILLAPAFKKKRKGCHTKGSSAHKFPEHKQVVSPSKAVPKSLSVLDMLRLGKVIGDSTEPITLYKFDIGTMTWCGTPITVEFKVEKEPLGTGGFREAYKATSISSVFGNKNQEWVVKKYLAGAKETIEMTNQTIAQHSKKVVQMHMLARNFASKLEEKLIKTNKSMLYGETLKYKKLYLGEYKDASVTVEEFIEGDFTKHINNTGVICGQESEIRSKAESLAHFSYECSSRKLMVVDMQGCGCWLFDPEIASQNIKEGDELLFTTGNLSFKAIENFLEAHKCNKYCNFLGLSSSV